MLGSTPTPCGSGEVVELSMGEGLNPNPNRNPRIIGVVNSGVDKEKNFTHQGRKVPGLPGTFSCRPTAVRVARTGIEQRPVLTLC